MAKTDQYTVSEAETVAVIADFLDMGHVDNIIAMFRQDQTLYDLAGDILNDERFMVRMGMVVLFGGYDGTTRCQDTWTYHVETNVWTEMSSSSKPSGRNSFGMVYDPKNGVSVLFGGYDSGGMDDETWTYDAGSDSWLHKVSLVEGYNTFAVKAFDRANNSSTAVIIIHMIAHQICKYSNVRANFTFSKSLQLPRV